MIDLQIKSDSQENVMIDLQMRAMHMYICDFPMYNQYADKYQITTETEFFSKILIYV